MASQRLRKALQLGLRSAVALLVGLGCNALTGPDLVYVEEGVGSQQPNPGPASAAEAGTSGEMPGGPAPTTEPCQGVQADCPGDEPVPIVTSPTYAACTADAECAPHRCLSGACSRQCQADVDCDGPGARCVRDMQTGLLGCARDCDLSRTSNSREGFQQCGPGMRCSATTGDSRAECSVALETGVEGARCETEADCRTDLNCYRGQCAPSCDPRAPLCSDERKCSAVTTRAAQEVGTCCSVPKGQLCNLVTDCGCDANETCQVESSGRTECRTLPAAPVASYARCFGHADCPRLHSCIDGVCKQRCQSVEDCGAEGNTCDSVVIEGGEPISIPEYSFCRRRCDLVSPQQPEADLGTCGNGANCVYSVRDARTDCLTAGAAGQGSPCTTVTDCAAGFRCVLQTCQRWCEPSSGSCGEGLTCSNIFSFAGRTLGLCCQPPADRACDWVTDCGCGVAETCSRDGELFCRPISQAPLPPNAACVDDVQCSRGHECVFGTCAERCRVASDCNQADVACVLFSDRDGEGRCSRTCDALAPQSPAAGFQACASGLMCVIVSAGGVGASYCRTPGAAAVGAACQDSAECVAGLRCSQDVCRPLCDLAADACPNGTVCTAAQPAVPIVGNRNLGVCLPD